MKYIKLSLRIVICGPFYLVAAGLDWLFDEKRTWSRNLLNLIRGTPAPNSTL